MSFHCLDCDIVREEGHHHPLILFEQDKKDGVEMILFPDVGYIKYKEFPDYLELRAIFMHHQFRGKGNGSKFVNALAEKARQMGKKCIRTHGSTDGVSDDFGRFLTANGWTFEEVDSVNFVKKI